jgi:hypothetical protein
MPIILHVEPQVPPMSWDDFCKNTPTYSIALDGYVNVGPRFEPNGPRANFNHHEEVDRLCTRATCGQILMAIRQGFFTCFRDKTGPRVHVYVNDCDEDVCTSWFLLKNEHLAKNHSYPALNRLVYMEDALDCTAGAYPFPVDLPVLEQLAWVFQPYRQFRLLGGLDKKDPNAYHGVITDVENRIMRHITGSGESICLDTRYDKIGGGKSWTLIREIGAQAKTGLFDDGYTAFVSVRNRSDGRWTYSIGRMSPFVPFDVPKIIEALNCEEKCTIDCWGGGNTIGGSPRVSGSSLTPEKVVEIVNSIVKSEE